VSPETLIAAARKRDSNEVSNGRRSTDYSTDDRTVRVLCLLFSKTLDTQTSLPHQSAGLQSHLRP
jgi:hypothetical protein